MDIKPSSGKPFLTDKLVKVAKLSSPAVVSTHTTRVSDESVTLTSTAHAINKAPFNHDRVRELKTALAEGRYQIDYQQLAGKIIDAECFGCR